MSVCTMLRLPVMITSRRWRLTASMRSPSTACEFRPRRGAGQGAGGDQLRYGVHPGRERIVAPGPDPGEQLPGLPAQQQDSLIQHAAEPELVSGDLLGAVPERPAAGRRAPGPLRVGDAPIQGDEFDDDNAHGGFPSVDGHRYIPAASPGLIAAGKPISKSAAGR